MPNTFHNFAISTHTPLTGRDGTGLLHSQTLRHFYSHAPYGTWHYGYFAIESQFHFYSHAPYGTWPMPITTITAIKPFLLTRPLRDVTSLLNPSSNLSLISTHTPLTGRDTSIFHTDNTGKNFYSHAPYGTWLSSSVFLIQFGNFYSHAPYGTWRIWYPVTKGFCRFLLTRPLRDVTRFAGSSDRRLLYFYSHAPYGTWPLHFVFM